MSGYNFAAPPIHKADAAISYGALKNPHDELKNADEYKARISGSTYPIIWKYFPETINYNEPAVPMYSIKDRSSFQPYKNRDYFEQFNDARRLRSNYGTRN